MRTIGFFVSPGFLMLDLAGPAGAFEAANRELRFSAISHARWSRPSVFSD
jgi:hypothetical protein